MRTKFLLVFFLCSSALALVPSFVEAADNINPRLDSLTTSAFERGGVPDVGDKMIDTLFGWRIINASIGQVCSDFNAIERFDTIVTANSTRWYSLNSDFSHLDGAEKYITDDNANNITLPLQYPPFETWYELKPKSEQAGVYPAPVGKKEEPRYARTFGTRIQFHPQPVAADTFIVTYYANDTSLTTKASQTSILPRYREAILLYAASMICEKKGDFTRADRFMARYNKLLADSRAKAEKQ